MTTRAHPSAHHKPRAFKIQSIQREIASRLAGRYRISQKWLLFPCFHHFRYSLLLEVDNAFAGINIL